MKTRFTVEVTPEQRVEVAITQEDVGGISFEVDAIEAMQMAKLLEAAAVAVQAQSTGAKPS